MSRLYTWLDTDAIKTTHTARGHQETEVRINWGCRGDSKKLVRVWVRWGKDTDTPRLFIEKDPQAKATVTNF